MKNILSMLLFVTLAGCVTNPIREKAAPLMDAMLHNAEMGVCNDASIGSIKRRYGKSRESVDRYNEFCRNVDFEIAGPEE